MNREEGSFNAPELSVVIPVRNGERTLALQLEALLKQASEVRLEVVVVDDNSSDNSRSLVEEWAERGLVRLVTLPSTRGPSAARNAGVAHASAALIGFCDADDVVYATWARDLLDGLNHAPLVAGGLAPFNSIPGDRPHDPLNMPEPMWCGLATVAPSANMGVTRELFMALGGFDESLRAGEDTDFCVRSFLYGTTLTPCSATVHYRHPTSVRANARKYARYAYWETIVRNNHAHALSRSFQPSLKRDFRAGVSHLLNPARWPQTRQQFGSWLIDARIKWARIAAHLRLRLDRSRRRPPAHRRSQGY